MKQVNRRGFVAGSALAVAAMTAKSAEKPEPKTPTASMIGLGFGTYGMKTLTVGDALKCCARIGYDAVELSLIAGWPSEASSLSSQDRQQIRKQLNQLNLSLPSLLESLPCLRTEQSHLGNLERLKRACQLGHDLSPDQPPVVQSIAGGKAASWEQDKQRMVDQLADWAEVGAANQTIICFKPHAAHAVHTPEQALWVHRQVANPSLKIVYDYSHYFLEGRKLTNTLRDLLPITAYVQVKDSRVISGKREYLLPGEGQTDYPELLTALRQSQYSGCVGVEVSSMIHQKPGYDPVQTAEACYKYLAPRFKQAGIERPRG